MKKKSNLQLRKDIVSRKMFPKDQLIRICKNKNNQVFIDYEKNQCGRGVYLQPNLEDIELARKTRAIERGLKCNINNLEKDLYDELKNILKQKNNIAVIDLGGDRMIKNQKNTTKNLHKKKLKQHDANIKDKLTKKTQVGLIDNVFVFTEPLSIADFAAKINKSPSEIVKHFFMQGIILNQNTVLSDEQMGEICLEYNYDFKKETQITKENIIETAFYEIEDESKLVKRPPIITIMGHVDHGKTTLLDTIRNTNVVNKEFGGITQHIGAYQINYDDNPITFIDTPGHEAFSEMRARGCEITDIVIIVVAADDGVKQQTEEAIDHAKAANIPIIVFVNKIDKPNANVEKVKAKLMKHNLVSEEFGGDIPFIEGSAKKNIGIDNLIETILLISEIQDYKAIKDTYARGIVLEAKLDKNRGPVTTVLIKSGTLHIKDIVGSSQTYGVVKSLEDENGKKLKMATPSKPVLITGWNEVPKASEKFMVFSNEKMARDIAEINKLKNKNKHQKASEFDIESIKAKIESGELKTLNIILKSDTQGTVEAIRNSLNKINVKGININIVRSGVGAISNADVTLAVASGSLIYGFNVRPTSQVKNKAEEDGIEIRLHNIIYKLVEEIEDLAKGLLDPEYEEVTLGSAEVRAIFKHSDIGTIAGCHIVDGLVSRNDKIHLLRYGIVIFSGELNSLKTKKEDLKEAKQGQECGMTIKNFNDIKVGDVIEAYKMEIVKNAN